MPHGEDRSFRSTTNLVIAVCAWVALGLGAAVALFLAAQGGVVRLLDLVPLALLALLVWELFWRPKLTVREDGVEIVDFFRTSLVPWTTIIDVQTRWALTLVTPHGKYRASVAPAPGARGRYRMGRASTQSEVGRDGGVLASSALGSDSGDAAAIVRAAWRERLDAGRIELGRADADRPRSTLHGLVLAATVVLVGGTAAILIAY
jgi:hypothetical protein